jgi:molecular chaperone DnaK
VPQVEVTFDIDANGILNVSAMEKTTGKQQQIKITHSSGLSEAEIEKMKKDAKEHEAEDTKRKEMIDMKNQADAMVFQGEKQLKEFEAKLTPELRSKVQLALDRLKDAVKTDNASSLKSAMDEYNTVWNEASSQMYSQSTAGADGQPQGEAGSQPGADASAGADPNVENADFEVVDDKDKDKK